MDYRTNGLGVARGIIVFQVVWPRDGFKTGGFVKGKLGGAIVERLVYHPAFTTDLTTCKAKLDIHHHPLLLRHRLGEAGLTPRQ